MYPIHENGQTLLYGGTAVGEVIFYQKNNKDLAMLKLKVSKEDVLQVIFADKVLLERLKKAKIKEKSYLTVLVTGTNEQKAVIGNDFKFSGIWKFKTKDDKTTTVISGTASQGRAFGNGAFCVSMPVKNKSETDWYSISFYNSEDTNKVKIADFAKKYLSENQFCTIRCGGVREKTIDGKVYRNLIGYKIYFPPKVD